MNTKRMAARWLFPATHLCNEHEVLEYRDMVVIVRDRIRDMIKKGMTLRTGEGRAANR